MTLRSTQLTMFRGDSQVWPFAVALRGAVVDITDVDVRFTAKRRAKDADVDAVLSKTVGSGITITDGAAGLLEVALSASDTDGLDAPLTLTWDLQVRDTAGRTQTVAHGELRILADISRTAP